MTSGRRSLAPLVMVRQPRRLAWFVRLGPYRLVITPSLLLASASRGHPLTPAAPWRSSQRRRGWSFQMPAFRLGAMISRERGERPMINLPQRVPIAILCGALIVACAATAQTHTVPSLTATLSGGPPLIIGHRGAAGHRPEHTLAS